MYVFHLSSFLRATVYFHEGDMGVYGIAVLSLFSSGISVILILMCGIAVSSIALRYTVSHPFV